MRVRLRRGRWPYHSGNSQEEGQEWTCLCMTKSTGMSRYPKSLHQSKFFAAPRKADGYLHLVLRMSSQPRAAEALALRIQVQRGRVRYSTSCCTSSLRTTKVRTVQSCEWNQGPFDCTRSAHLARHYLFQEGPSIFHMVNVQPTRRKLATLGAWQVKVSSDPQVPAG